MSLGSQSPIGISVYHPLIEKKQNSMIESKKMENGVNNLTI